MKKNNHLIVGILTTEGKNSPITGNFELFRDLSRKLAEKGRTVVVLTSSSLQNNKINGGYIFYEKKNSWAYVSNIGTPTVIYNRIPYRKDEQTEQFKTFSAWCKTKRIPMFNCSFFKKWDIYSILQKDAKLKKHLPFTEKVQSKEQLEQRIRDFRSLYLKPNDGSKGNGIFVLSINDNDSFQLKGHGKIYGSTFFQNIWDRKIAPLLEKREYIIQQKKELLQQNERTYDYRVLVHHVKNNWIVTGIGIRQSKRNGITTHVLKGGNLLEVKQVTNEKDLEYIQLLAKRTGKVLEKAIRPGVIKEFSMDIGKTVDHQFFIFDVNSKPMKFDEPDIYENCLNHLVEIFLEYDPKKIL